MSDGRKAQNRREDMKHKKNPKRKKCYSWWHSYDLPLTPLFPDKPGDPYSGSMPGSPWVF